MTSKLLLIETHCTRILQECTSQHPAKLRGVQTKCGSKQFSRTRHRGAIRFIDSAVVWWGRWTVPGGLNARVGLVPDKHVVFAIAPITCTDVGLRRFKIIPLQSEILDVRWLIIIRCKGYQQNWKLLKGTVYSCKCIDVILLPGGYARATPHFSLNICK